MLVLQLIIKKLWNKQMSVERTQSGEHVTQVYHQRIPGIINKCPLMIHLI